MTTTTKEQEAEDKAQAQRAYEEGYEEARAHWWAYEKAQTKAKLAYEEAEVKARQAYEEVKSAWLAWEEAARKGGRLSRKDRR